MSQPPPSGDLYEVLGVAHDASAEDIKKAFRALARSCHPDVAGSAPETVERFKQIKRAYDVLGDAEARARYDRRRAAASQRRRGRSRMPGGFYFWEQGGADPADPPPGPGQQRYARERGNDIDLDDLFGDHGGFVDFGFGDRGFGDRARRSEGAYGGEVRPQPGSDIALTVDVPWNIARSGGTVTLTYPRARRSEDGRSALPYDEIYDLRVPPGTQHGETLRAEGWGNAGTGGAPDGDLVCDIRVVGGARGGPSERPGPPPPPDPRPADAPMVVPISVVEALLGGRIELTTPGGPVSLSLPPCTSGGARFRLRGKGQEGPDGRRGDLTIQLRVVTPPLLDDESRALIERFAQLNDHNPREP